LPFRLSFFASNPLFTANTLFGLGFGFILIKPLEVCQFLPVCSY